ncbi:alkene reductase (plasmid) [Pseudoalteromonas piscicida]|uniref:alkene reductase n=1 Tax=Pseudoalteromonas piscicida TaxID=43662 RepID=UPI001D0A7A3C|nr:alkene reductase [Pseudoalteromonas piscicida]UDM64016.1 alkene reductase [Pseudoalteromonas piscicida]
MADLFESINLAGKTLSNRIVMPPMTRSRASQPGDTPNSLMATYYAQRATAGLIISEGTQISQLGKGYAWTSGIYSDAQVAGWKQVTKQVHDAGGVMFAQLWHVGRVSHQSNTGGLQPISASAIQAQGVKVFIDENDSPDFIQAQTPRAMTQADINNVINEYRHAARNAMQAGFDGIELHAANGYLINQFLDSHSNQRTDGYGGSVDNRIRFLREVVTAVSEEIGSDKVGVRLAPLTTLNGTVDENPEQTYLAAIKQLNALNVSYVHIAEADWEDAPDMPLKFKYAIREEFNGVLIYAGKYTKARAQQALNEGWADMIGFGRPFISNPDLPYRLANDLYLNEHQPETLFGGGEQGYTDYQIHASNPINVK